MCPVGESVGGCGARAVSRKTSIYFIYRKQIRVDEIFVHENFTTTGSKANDIALLRLGENQKYR